MSEKTRHYEAQAIVFKNYDTNLYKIVWRVKGKKRNTWSGTHPWKDNIKVSDLGKEISALKAHIEKSIRKEGDTLNFQAKPGGNQHNAAAFK